MMHIVHLSGSRSEREIEFGGKRGNLGARDPVSAFSSDRLDVG
jgi:hypothetical protein